MVRVGEEPTTLLVSDVGAHLAKLLRACEGIKVIVLRLEIDAHQQQHLPCRVVCCTVPLADDNHGECHRQIKRVECSLVLHEQGPSVRSELLKLTIRADGVQELATFCLECRFQEEVHQPHEVGLLAKVALEHLVNKHLHHEEVVCRQQADVRQLVPARSSAAREGPIHHVVGHEHAGLQQLHCPAQHREAMQVPIRWLLALVLHQLDARLDANEAPVHLAAKRVVIEGAGHPLDLFGGHLVKIWELFLHLL
mmetsp:Transcript_59083/g.149672  ORF Transcript_59083/g.149672 Transcript_59083/m.149672 type:complete len:252 (+) Transcript_59083:310-1065(+)